jgi:hypothetical protein
LSLKRPSRVVPVITSTNMRRTVDPAQATS